MADTSLGKVRKHFAQLRQERRSWEPFWRDVKEYIVPRRGRFLFSSSSSEVNQGVPVADRRLNAAASRALSILASGMQSGLTSKARQWFLLTHPDPEVSRYQPVRVWYDQVQDVLEGVYRRSNVYSALLHTYYEMAGFGTGALSVLSHPDKVMFCRPYTTGSYYLSTDHWFEVDSFYYTEYLTAHQLLLNYGRAALPAAVLGALDSDRHETRFETVNAILRHPEQFGVAAPGGKPIASVHFLSSGHDGDKFLRVSGYDSWPVMTPRWDVVDVDVYGAPPTEDILGDIRMVQRMEADGLKGLAKGVTPPMRIPPELERRGLNMQPGGLNVVSSMNEHAVAPLMTAQVNMQQLQMKIDRVIEGIRDGLYNSLFLALLTQDNPQMTAREVAERHEEKLLMLGPVLERIHYELLDPLIARTFALANEAGLIPPPPADVDLGATQIEYVSILSQAQKAVGVSRIEQSVQFLGNMVAVYPEVRHALNPLKAYKEYNNMIGVRAGIFTSDDEYRKAVDAENQAAAAAQGAATGESLATSAKLLNDVDPANMKRLLTGDVAGGLVL